MASSGHLNSTSFEGRYIQFAWTARTPDIANNKTTIDWTLKGAGEAQAGYYTSGNFRVKIDGTQVYFSSERIRLYNGTVIATGSRTFTHNENGSGSFSVAIEAGIYTVAVNCTGSGSFTLDTIARASQPSCITYPNHTQNVGNFGDTISIHMNRKSSTFKHTVRYAFGSTSGTCINADTGKATNKDVETGFKWKVPEALMNQLPSSTSGSGMIYVDTYNGSTLVGTKSCGFTATVPSSVKPTVSLSLEDTTGADQTYGSPVKGLSNIKVTVSATPAYGSQIASYIINADGVRYNKSTANTGPLRTSGSSVVTVSVTDKRGRTNTTSYTMSVQNYTPPTISALAVHRCNQDGTTNDRGEYVKVTFSAAVSSMSSKNTAQYKLSYKKPHETTFTTITLPLANNYTVSDYSYIFAADGSSSYDVTVTASDRHNSTPRSTSASTAFTLINFHPSGNGIAFGGVAEEDEENVFRNNLSLRQVGNHYSFQPGSFNGEKGYTLMAVITLKSLNVNAPIVFVLGKRGVLSPMQVNIQFAASSTTEDPELALISYEGSNLGAYLVKSATSTWKLYIDNTGGWSNPCVLDWYTTGNQDLRISVEFSNEQVASLPTPYYRATPLVTRSILDCFFPVGYILLLYSHADPNEMYPGSSWTRISNAFLWAVDASGQIGLTGGAKEVTLTEAQLPAHSHGSVYSQHAEGTKSTAWYSTSGTALAYGPVETGGGQAHNNMPPYIQISAWRRTS